MLMRMLRWQKYQLIDIQRWSQTRLRLGSFLKWPFSEGECGAPEHLQHSRQKAIKQSFGISCCAVWHCSTPETRAASYSDQPLLMVHGWDQTGQSTLLMGFSVLGCWFPYQQHPVSSIYRILSISGHRRWFSFISSLLFNVFLYFFFKNCRGWILEAPPIKNNHFEVWWLHPSDLQLLLVRGLLLLLLGYGRWIL